VTAPTDAPTHGGDAAAETAPPIVLEPRQRWRLTFARVRPGPDEVPTGRDYIGRWETSLLSSGLPVLLLASGRPRVALGAPLPSGCSAEAELVEFWLTEIRPAWQVRERIGGVLPVGHSARGLENVWLGAPALSGQVAAAEYVVGIDGASGRPLAAATQQLLARDRVVRERFKGGEAKTYDLRALLLSVEVIDESKARAAIRMRTRIHPELGTGRPDEVVAALAAETGQALAITDIVRERLLLADEIDAG
jgi:radical SAM-linked protein